MSLDWRLRERTWQLVDDHGRILETIQHDGERYVDGRGAPLSRRWDEAKVLAEKRAKNISATKCSR